MKNPHNRLRRQGKPPLNKWKCHYCKEKGTLEELESKECSYVYPPCEYCGQTPLCSPNCEGIFLALSNSNIYLSEGVGNLDGVTDIIKGKGEVTIHIV